MEYTLDKGNARLTAAGCKKNSNQMLSVWLQKKFQPNAERI